MKNEFEIRDDTVEIFFNENKLRIKSFFISLEDFNKVNDFPNTWIPHEKVKGYGVYVKGQIKGKVTSLHRFILDAPENLVVDHINGDTLDNRRSNLRLATKSQNQWNRTVRQRNNTSGFTGVRWDKERGKWKAYARKYGKEIYLGRYDNFEIAKQKVIDFWKDEEFRDAESL